MKIKIRNARELAVKLHRMVVFPLFHALYVRSPLGKGLKLLLCVQHWCASRSSPTMQVIQTSAQAPERVQEQKSKVAVCFVCVCFYYKYAVSVRVRLECSMLVSAPRPQKASLWSCTQNCNIGNWGISPQSSLGSVNYFVYIWFAVLHGKAVLWNVSRDPLQGRGDGFFADSAISSLYTEVNNYIEAYWM